VALLVAALVGVFLIGWSGSPVHKSLREGLDLQGGLEVVLQAQPPRGHVLTPDDITRSVDIMRNRIDRLGVSEPVVTKQGKDQIVIELPAVHNINQAASIIGETAQLELYDLETSLVPPSVSASQTPITTTSLFDLLTSVQSGQKGLPSQYYLFNSRTKKPVAGPTETLTQLKRDPAVKALKPLKPKQAKRKTSAATPLKTRPAAARVVSSGKPTSAAASSATSVRCERREAKLL